MLKILSAVALATLVGSCTTTGSSPDNQNDSVYHINYQTRDAYVDKTLVTNSGSHGVQVEFHSRSGKTFLWYPGNRNSLPGRWLVIDPPDRSVRLCYKYGTNTYNPVTKTSGGEFLCRPMRASINQVKFICDGDPFKLSSGRLPFNLAEPNALERVKAVCGRSLVRP